MVGRHGRNNAVRFPEGVPRITDGLWSQIPDRGDIDGSAAGPDRREKHGSVVSLHRLRHPEPARGEPVGDGDRAEMQAAQHERHGEGADHERTGSETDRCRRGW